MTTRSPEQVLQGFELAMGPNLGPAFGRLWNDCVLLHLEWHEYQLLFATSDARIQVLRASADGCFGVIERAMWESVVMALCRFTDPPKSAGKETLSVQGLPALIDDLTRRQRVEELSDEAVARTAFARDARNRAYAHRDRQLALTPHVNPLRQPIREEVQQAVDAITVVLAYIEQQYCQAQTHYPPLAPLGDADALVRVLEDGLQARDARLR